MTDRERKLGRARADLVELPDLLDQLARCLTERDPSASGGGGKVTGSAAPLRLEVLHLVDAGRKRDWSGEDPRSPRYELTWTAPGSARAANGTLVPNTRTQLFPSKDAALDFLQRIDAEGFVVALRAGDRYGVAATLESWTRVVGEEMPDAPEMAESATARSEASVLVEAWPWICEQRWAEDLALDVSGLAKQVRRALGIRLEEPRYVCPECRSRAYIRFGDNFLVCEEGHEQSVRNLEERERRRPALSTEDIVAEFGVSRDQLYSWRKRRQIQPQEVGGRLRWFPWDVFCKLNPDLAAAIDARDESVRMA